MKGDSISWLTIAIFVFSSVTFLLISASAASTYP